MDQPRTASYETTGRLEEAVESFMKAQDAGQKPDPNDWLRRYSDVAEELRQFFVNEGILRREPVTSEGPSLVETLRHFGNYELIEEIGHGGIGVVVRGRDRDLGGRDLAVKVLRKRFADDAVMRQRFIEEAHLGAQLQHPGIVPIHAKGELPDGRPYFTMKLVRGQTLHSLLTARADPSKDLPRFLAIFEQICQTVAYAHSRGVIHRDLKPLNVMVGAFGEVQVMDWGLAKVVGTPPQSPPLEGGETRGDDHAPAQPVEGERSTLEGARADRAHEPTQAGIIMGTPAYLAPEQARGMVEELDQSCDVFSLGAILCEILTGTPPYMGRNRIDLLMKAQGAHLADAFSRLDLCGADAELVHIAKRCLAPIPAERPRDAIVSAKELASYLASVQERLKAAEIEKAAADAKAEEARAKAAAERRVRRWTGAFAAALIIGTVVSLTFAYQATENADKEKSARSDADRKAAEATRNASDTRREIEKLYVANGLRAADADDLHTALLWFAKPLQADHGPVELEELHRIRLASYLRHVPRPTLLHVLAHPGKIVNHAEFSSDGSRVVTFAETSTRRSGEARVWDTNTGKPIGPSLNDLHRFLHPAMSPDGRRIVAMSVDGTVRVWDAVTAKPLGPPLAHDASVVDASFSADGRHILALLKNKTVRLWDVQDGLDVTSSLNELRAAQHAAFSPGGRYLLTVNREGTMLVRDLFGGKLVGLFLTEPTRKWKGARLSPDGRRVIVDGFDAWIGDLATGETFTVRARGEISPDGRRVVTRMGSIARVVDAATGEPICPPLIHDDEVSGATYSADGRRVATRTSDRVTRVWNVATGQPCTPPLHGEGGLKPSPNGGLSDVTIFSSDGRRIVTITHGAARVWDLATAQAPPRLFLGHGSAVAFGRDLRSTDGVRIVTFTGTTAQVRLAATREPLGSPLVHPGRVVDAGFVPGGNFSVTLNRTSSAAGLHETVSVWDPATGQLLGSPMIHHGQVTSITISADGRRIATAVGSQGMVWEVASGQSIGRQMVHADAMEALRFSPDGRSIVTASRDKTARVWEVETGNPLTPPFGHQSWVKYATFSPNGRYVLTHSEEQTARLWDVSTGQALTPSLNWPGQARGIAFSPDGKQVTVWPLGKPPHVWHVSPDKPASDLVLFARLLRGEAQDKGGGLVPLSPEELQTAWQALLEKYPSDFTVTCEQALAWHRREAEACLKEKNAPAAVFHHLHSSWEWAVLTGWPQP